MTNECLHIRFFAWFVCLFALFSAEFNFAHKWNELEMDSVQTWILRMSIFILFKIYEMKNVDIFELVFFYSLMADMFAAVQFFWGFCFMDVPLFPIHVWVSEWVNVLVCVVACQEGKKTFTRKQCFYSNCYSVAHSWHYFPSLIKFHPNHNSNHVGALLQSLSNAHYHHRTSCHHHVRLCVQYNTIHAYILTFLTFLWHSPKANSIHLFIITLYIYLYMLNGEREKKKKSWSTTVFYIFIELCVMAANGIQSHINITLSIVFADSTYKWIQSKINILSRLW